MENINAIVAKNIRRLRERDNMSLDSIAKLTGVSKSMLSQIERGDVNPTVSTVWKIANGLKVSFTDLTSRPESEYEVIDKLSVHPFIEDGGNYRNYPMFPFDSNRQFELYYIEIEPGGCLAADAHPAGTQEFITAFSGSLCVSVNGMELSISCGGSMRFRADAPHSYNNTADELCRLSMVIYYPRR